MLKSDECVYTKKDILYLLYTDDSIIMGPDEEKIEQTIKEMRNTGLNLTVLGTLEEFLGVQLKSAQQSVHIRQPYLIESILK